MAEQYIYHISYCANLSYYIPKEMEKLLSSFSYKLHLCSCLIYKFYCFCKSTWFLITFFYQHVLLRIDTFFIQLIFYLSFSSLGFWLLMVTKPRTTIDHNGSGPSKLDLFYTSVSAVTTSSMSVVEMESFSDNQLVILALLMFLGGDVCISMLGLHFGRIPKLAQSLVREEGKVDPSAPHPNNFLESSSIVITVVPPDTENSKSELDITSDRLRVDGEDLKYKSTKFLGLVVLIFLLVNHISGFVFVSVYLALVSSARSVLEKKGIKTLTFVVFVTVSTFSGCGFLPTNESMIVFNKNSGLLLSLIPQILLGNTLFPVGLRFFVWVLGKLFKKEEADYLMRNERVVRYFHWLTARHLWLLAASVFGFVLVQFVMLSAMEWRSKGLSGMSSYERLVALLFQSVSTRYAGENVIDLSKVAPAIWVLFILMMYLPSRTCFDMGAKDVDRRKKRRGKVMENFLFSQLSYLVIAVILICITERKEIQKDPINFNVFNIVVEVISAYGNVGYTMGYNCELQMNRRDVNCVNKSYGFSGRWSDEGKSILILVMLFGRLKKYSMGGSKAWKLT